VAADAADIGTAARWAAENDLQIGVLNTGHGMLDDQRASVLINTAGLRGVRADPAARRVVVQPGARWADVQSAVTPVGLTGVCGAMPGVGVVGYALGGGLSPLGRTFGMGADRIRRLTVLDAEYRPVDITAASDADLFWALCGGGGLSLVTKAELELVELPTLFGGGVYFSGEHAPSVLSAYRDWTATLDERTTTSIALLHLPPLPQLPKFLRGRYVVHLRIAHVDPGARDLEGAGRTLIAPMLVSAPAIDNYTRIMSPSELPDIHRDPVTPAAVSYRGGHITELDDAAIASLVEAADPGVGHAPALIEIRQLGGAMSAPTAAANSATARGTGFHVWVNDRTDPGDPSASRALVNSVAAQVGASVYGAQLNFYGPTSTAGEILQLWDQDAAVRLTAVARRIDPDGRIRTGHPIFSTKDSPRRRPSNVERD
jgi:hypothetical protein